jgi:hypothetical protein
MAYGGKGCLTEGHVHAHICCRHMPLPGTAWLPCMPEKVLLFNRQSSVEDDGGKEEAAAGGVADMKAASDTEQCCASAMNPLFGAVPRPLMPADCPAVSGV